MHANVGGGYPDDALAEIPLYWIMKEAERCGLRFIVSPQQPDALLVTQSARDKDGRLYDSRSGAASYYRYGPRDVGALCDDRQNGVKIERPLIHQSVFARMLPNATAYAPIGLPQIYAVIAKDGTIVSKDAAGFETEQEARARYKRQQLAWDLVWWRRIVYFLTVIASLHLVVFPLIYRTYMPEEYTTSFRFVWKWCVLSYLSAGLRYHLVVRTYMPPTRRRCCYRSVPSCFSRCGGAELHTMIDGSDACRLAQRGPAAKRSDDSNRPFCAFRAHGRLVSHRPPICWYKLAPGFFAIFTVVACAAIVCHVAFYLEDAAGLTCTRTPNAKPLALGHTSEQLTFTPDHLCWSSGI